MRTTLDLPDELIDAARESLGFKSKTDTGVFALREVVRRGRIDELKALMGKVHFEGDPMEMRNKERRKLERMRELSVSDAALEQLGLKTAKRR